MADVNYLLLSMQSDQERIFQPFEKVNTFTPNAGLGLTFAAQYAATLGGSVALVSSELGKGSVFKLHLPNPILASSLQMHKTRKLLPQNWAYWMNKTYDMHDCDSIYGDTLQNMGIALASSPTEASIVVQPMTQLPDHPAKREDVQSHQILLMLGWEEDYHLRSTDAGDGQRTVYGRLPWTRSRLIATLLQAQQLSVKNVASSNLRKSQVPTDQVLKLSLLDKTPNNVGFCGS